MVIFTPGQNLLECSDQELKPLVRCDVAKEQNRLLAIHNVQSPPCLIFRETCVSNGIVDSKGNDTEPLLSCAKLIDELALHLLRVNEDMIGKPILHSQREAIEGGISRIPLTRVHIVNGQNGLFPESPVVKHQQRSIEQLELVVPENMEDYGLGGSGIADQFGVVHREPEHFP